MTRNVQTPETSAADTTAPSEESPRKGRSGPVAELGLVAAALGLVVYLIGFVATIGGTSSPVVPLLLGGGLLAGSVALPTVGSRVLAPAAVVVTTGALLLLRTVVDSGGGVLVVGALVLALLEAAAAVGATLMDAGLLRARQPKPRKAPESAFSGHPGGPQFPGQQYPGQPFPGAFGAGPRPPEAYPGDQWAGEHAYAQNAQFGAQYGVPGYPPPPPPFGAPGYDAALQRSEAPTVAVGTEAAGEPSTRATRPAADAVAGADAGSAFRSGAEPATGGIPGLGGGSHRAAPDAAGSPFRASETSGTGSHRAVSEQGPVSGTGSYRSTGPGSYPAVPDAPGSGTGSFRSTAGAGSYPPAGESSSFLPGRRPEAEPTVPPESENENTRAIPTVTDDKP